MHRTNICFVTEIDIDRKLGGAITNDLKTLNCLRKLATVDIIYLKGQKYGSVWAALPMFALQILRSSSKRYQAYFSRGVFASFALIVLKPIHRKKVIHNALSVPFPSLEAEYSIRNKLFGFIWFCLMRFLEQIVTRNADAIVVADDSYANEFVKNGVLGYKVQTVPFYVEDEFFQQPIRSSVNGTCTFCYIGGFHPYHMLLPVIEAFEQLLKKKDNVELCLVGEGPLRPVVENEVSKRKLSQKIKSFGSISHSSVPNFLSGVDSFIVPIQKPGISTSLLEAAAAGKAIITLRRRGDLILERYFGQGKEILYVENASAHEIAEAMRLVSENSEVRKTLSFGARRIAKQYFSEEICVNRARVLMQKILGDHVESVVPSKSTNNEANK